MNNRKPVQIRIAEATAADIDVVVAMRMAFLQRDNPFTPRQRAVMLRQTRRYFAGLMKLREVRVWLLHVDGEVAATGGYVLFKRAPISPRRLRGEAYLFNCFTLPQYRRRGLATRLLKHIVRQVRAAGLTRVWLRATDDGRGLYEKNGFCQSTSVMDMKL